MLCDVREAQEGGECMYTLKLILVQWKPTQYCKATILQLKKKNQLIKTKIL